jgi:hypothetical protein
VKIWYCGMRRGTRAMGMRERMSGEVEGGSNVVLYRRTFEEREGRCGKKR